MMATKVAKFGASTASGAYRTCKVGSRWYFYPNDNDWLSGNGNDSFSEGYGSQVKALEAAERFEAAEECENDNA